MCVSAIYQEVLFPLNRRTKLEFILALTKPLAEALKFA